MPNGYYGGPANNWAGYSNNGWGQQSVQPAVPQSTAFQQIFVQGEAGAKAFQLPPGCTFATLWDTEAQIFYIKRIDQNGRPFPLEAYDYTPHVDPASQPIDLSKYVTTEQLSQYVTVAQLKELLENSKGGNAE